MKVSWSKRAIRNLIAAHAYIAKDSSDAAARVAAGILEATVRMQQFPHSGRPGRNRGTRELVVAGLPYILVYRVGNGIVTILAVIHTSRKWPKEF